MSKDGLLPPAFGRVHPRYRTPHVATAVTSVVAAIMAGLFPVGLLAELVSIGTLMAFIMVCASVLLLRYTRPEVPRPFRVPVPWFTCLGGVGFCALMAVSLGVGTWIRLIVWFLIGLCVYGFYSRHNSVLHRSTVGSP
jgi:APA family basic amino acid/polyamine antiporter